MIKCIGFAILLLAFSGGAYAGGLVDEAQMGDVDAQLELGLRYASGRKTTKDPEQAVYWFSRAAEQGDATAQGLLGSAYSEGKGATQDYRKAIYWWTQSAEQGDSYSQHNLGMAYYTGKGTPKDYRQAYVWFLLSAANGSATPAGDLAAVASQLTTEELQSAKAEAETLQHKIESIKEAQG
jgi:hypothetical protein